LKHPSTFVVQVGRARVPIDGQPHRIREGLGIGEARAARGGFPAVQTGDRAGVTAKRAPQPLNAWTADGALT
jgi:hypothetical protein